MCVLFVRPGIKPLCCLRMCFSEGLTTAAAMVYICDPGQCFSQLFLLLLSLSFFAVD